MYGTVFVDFPHLISIRTAETLQHMYAGQIFLSGFGLWGQTQPTGSDNLFRGLRLAVCLGLAGRTDCPVSFGAVPHQGGGP